MTWDYTVTTYSTIPMIYEIDSGIGAQARLQFLALETLRVSKWQDCDRTADIIARDEAATSGPMELAANEQDSRWVSCAVVGFVFSGTLMRPRITVFLQSYGTVLF